MRNPLASLSPRTEKVAFVALIVLLYVLGYAFEPGTFPEVLVRGLFSAAGFATGWGLAYLTPSPRRPGRRATRLLAAALAVGGLAVFLALPAILGPHLGELARGLLIGCFFGTFADRAGHPD